MDVVSGSIKARRSCCKVCSGSKVSILGVESLLPFSAWIFLGCKSTNILYKLGVNKIEKSAVKFIKFVKYLYKVNRFVMF